MNSAPLTDDELRRELRELCNQGRNGPVVLPPAVAAVLVQHGLAEQLSDAIWLPTPRGRSWCETEEALRATPPGSTTPPSDATDGGRKGHER